MQGKEEEKKRKGKKDRKRKDKRTRKGRGSCTSHSGRGKVKERTRRIGSFSGLGLLFEQMGITTVSLGIWRISPLAYTQPCVKQIQTGELRMHRRITF